MINEVVFLAEVRAGWPRFWMELIELYHERERDIARYNGVIKRGAVQVGLVLLLYRPGPTPLSLEPSKHPPQKPTMRLRRWVPGVAEPSGSSSEPGCPGMQGL